MPASTEHWGSFRSQALGATAPLWQRVDISRGAEIVSQGGNALAHHVRDNWKEIAVGVGVSAVIRFAVSSGLAGAEIDNNQVQAILSGVASGFIMGGYREGYNQMMGNNPHSRPAIGMAFLKGAASGALGGVFGSAVGGYIGDRVHGVVEVFQNIPRLDIGTPELKSDTPVLGGLGQAKNWVDDRRTDLWNLRPGASVEAPVVTSPDAVNPNTGTEATPASPQPAAPEPSPTVPIGASLETQVQSALNLMVSRPEIHMGLSKIVGANLEDGMKIALNALDGSGINTAHLTQAQLSQIQEDVQYRLQVIGNQKVEEATREILTSNPGAITDGEFYNQVFQKTHELYKDALMDSSVQESIANQAHNAYVSTLSTLPVPPIVIEVPVNPGVTTPLIPSIEIPGFTLPDNIIVDTTRGDVQSVISALGERGLVNGSNPWEVSKTLLKIALGGRDPSPAEIMELTKALVKSSGIEVKDWGTTGVNEYLLPVGKRLIVNEDVQSVLNSILMRSRLN